MNGLEHFLGAVYDLRWFLVLIVFAVLVFLWRAARFDEDVAVRAARMRAATIRGLEADNANLRRRLLLIDLADPQRAGKVVRLPGRTGGQQ